MTDSFARFTDTARMRADFQALLPGFRDGTVTIAGCEVLHARYRTYRKLAKRDQEWLSVSYQLDLRDRDGTPSSQMVLLRARRSGASAAEYQSALNGPLAAPRHGAAVAHLPDLDATVWSFPNDPDLPHLARMLDPRFAALHLPYDRLPEVDGPESISSVSVHIVHYYPAQRCMARFEAQPKFGAAPIVLYGKVFRCGLGRSAHELLAALWASGTSQDFRVPEPLGFDPDHHIMWLRAVEVGTAMVFEGPDRTVLAEDAGRRLALLHLRDLPVSDRLDPADQLTELEDKLEKVALAAPGQADVTERLLRRLRADHASLTATTPRVTHGDFHPGQLGLAGRDLVLFDFDEFVVADPARDVASFVVGLHADPRTSAAAHDLAAAFCDGYDAVAPRGPSDDHLTWQLRVQLATKAYRAYRRHEPRMSSRISGLLATAMEDRVLEILTTPSKEGA